MLSPSCLWWSFICCLCSTQLALTYKYMLTSGHHQCARHDASHGLYSLGALGEYEEDRWSHTQECVTPEERPTETKLGPRSSSGLGPARATPPEPFHCGLWQGQVRGFPPCLAPSHWNTFPAQRSMQTPCQTAPGLDFKIPLGSPVPLMSRLQHLIFPALLYEGAPQSGSPPPKASSGMWGLKGQSVPAGMCHHFHQRSMAGGGAYVTENRRTAIKIFNRNWIF